MLILFETPGDYKEDGKGRLKDTWNNRHGYKQILIPAFDNFFIYYRPYYYDLKREKNAYMYVAKDSSGRKKMIEKRIPRDVDYQKLFSEGKINIKNAGGTWMISPDGADVMAFHLIFQLFPEYQTQGKIPLKLSAYY